MAKEQERHRAVSIARSRWLFAALSFVAIVYTFAGAWLVTAGPADPVEHTAAFLAHLVSPWMLAGYVVAAAFIGFGAWHLGSVPSRAGGGGDIYSVTRQAGVRLALVLVLVAACLSGIGWLYIRDIENASLAERSRQLVLVARLNAQHIGKWLVARSVDSELLANSLARLPLDRLPDDHELVRGVELLFAEMLAANPERVAVTLFAVDGQVLAHAGKGAVPDALVVAAARALAAAPSTAPRIVDLYDEGAPPQPHMGFIASVAARGAFRPEAVLAITVDPFHGLLDQLQASPTADPGSAVLVVRRDDKDVIFITPPRLSPEPPPNTYRVPLATDTLPAVQAMQRGDGVYRGHDPGGVEVLSAAQRVNGVPWTVLAQTDEADMMAPLHRRERTLMLVIGAAIILAAIMLLVLWRGEYVALKTQRDLADTERVALSQHFAQLTRLARDIVLMVNPEGRIIEANEAALAAYGYSEAELYRLTVADLRTPGELPKFEQQWRGGSTPDGVLIETMHRRKDGSSFPVEISGRVIEVDGRPYRQAFIRDISVRRKLEREVERLSQVRSALHAATSVLLRVGDEHALYRGVCEVMVRLGAYTAAYVGLPVDDPGRSVRFVAVSGVDDGYLDRAGITWDDGPHGRGPTGAALRTGEIQVDQHLADNPALAPWRDEALERGAHACVGLPLKADGRVFAAFTVHAGQPDAFDAGEVTLLAALADDIAFAVDRLRTANGHAGPSGRRTA
jgi:PAS domain S-box-containing protein